MQKQQTKVNGYVLLVTILGGLFPFPPVSFQSWAEAHSAFRKCIKQHPTGLVRLQIGGRVVAKHRPWADKADFRPVS